MLMPETTANQGTVMAERIRREFAAHPHRPLPLFAEAVYKTVSIDVAQWVDAEDPYAVVERADQAMYQAKTSGKNNVQTA